MQEPRFECWIIRIEPNGHREFWRRCNGFPGCESRCDQEKGRDKKDWVEIPEKEKKKMEQKSLMEWK